MTADDMFTQNVEVNVNNLSSSSTSGGETWLLSCQAYDGDDYGNWQNSSSVYITYNGPTPPSPSLASVDGLDDPSSVLNCSDTLYDGDNGNINVTVKWYKDGVYNRTDTFNNNYPNGTGFSALLGSANTSRADQWLCGMQLTDRDRKSVV